ncbi:hypothetical protein NW768_007084 [Fusarium equiseti]|uniref:Uncharacterized protein n=1 Tax=Fusarium equiseti TaxID=61235 RepID=A0ABQ8RA17_FUSEQ|nr:hypothetical protein NW768_007084 [Fusarium equiseti]
MAPKAPSEGQKVDLGQNAPVKEEGAGKVASESLAAESAKEGGDFASNEGIRSENQASSRSENTSAGRTTNTSSAPSSNSNSNSNSAQSGSAKSNAGTAPSYVDAQYIKASGPHGKNITEGFDDSKTEDGLKKALEAEPGSENDPSRVAELQFQQNQTAAGRDAGPKQTGLANETSFDALNNETSS